MKSPSRSFANFSRTERIGLICIILLLLILLIIRVTFSFIEKRTDIGDKEKQLAAAWSKVEQSRPAPNSDTNNKVPKNIETDSIVMPVPGKKLPVQEPAEVDGQHYDANTIDSENLLTFVHLDPNQVHQFLAYRRKIGGFKQGDDICNIPDMDRNMNNKLCQSLVVATTK